MPPTTTDVLVQTAGTFIDGFRAALPAILAGAVFLLVAGGGVFVLLRLLRLVLGRALPGTEPALRQFVVRIVGVFCWFGVGLAFLSILGLQQIAAALGTASGFVALGVSYALSGMLADAVAGVYLLRDPDFNPGDEVVVGDMTGVVETIELRKSRFVVEGDTVVRANADIEKRWTKRGPPAE